ncbi:MAG: hypothetical protein ACE5GN_03735, partial [Waddliaceae bacterium]
MNKISLDPYRHLEPFLRQKLFNDAWLQDFVTAESREKAQNIYKQFPYLPLQKNNNNHISIGKDVKSPAGFNQDPNIAPTEDQTCYLVQMPWTPPKQEDAKYAALSDSRAHFAKGIARLKRIEEALATETLGTTKEESEKEAAKRLSCVIGINRVYSLDINYNGEFRDFIASIPKMDRVALRILPFLWSPWQTRYISPVILNKFNGNAGWIYPIDKAYLLVKRLCSEKPWMIPALETYLHVKDHFHSLYRPKETLIPYQHIRDYVMHSAEMNRFLELFRRRAPKALTYVANLDSDFSALKTDEFGLYSHYDRIAQEHFAQHRKNA